MTMLLFLKRSAPLRIKSLSFGHFFSTETIEWNKLISGVQYFNNIFGEALIPADFIVPVASVHWPPSLHGFHLGKQVMLARPLARRPKFKLNWTELNKLGLMPSSTLQRNLVVLKALMVHKTIFGDLQIKWNYIIPCGPSDPSPAEVATIKWPRSTWGLKLGATLNNIRGHQRHKAIHKQLIEMGIDLDISREKHFDAIYRALQIFLKLHGHVRVPQKFVVPEDEATEDAIEKTLSQDHDSSNDSDSAQQSQQTSVADWPVDLRGLKLGGAVSEIKYNSSYAWHRNELEALGIVYPLPKLQEKHNSPAGSSKSVI